MNENEGTACQNLENVVRTVHKDILSLRILHLVYLTCMDILPACISVQPLVCLIPLEAKRLCWSPWKLKMAASHPVSAGNYTQVL